MKLFIVRISCRIDVQWIRTTKVVLEPTSLPLAARRINS